MTAQQLRILLVSATDGERHEVQQCLARPGLSREVVWASPGETALRQAQAETYGLMLISQRPGETGGLDTCRHVRELRLKLPIVFLASPGDEDAAVDALRMGAQEYLVKDTEGGYLRLLPNVVRRALRQWEDKQSQRSVQARLLDATEQVRRWAEEVEERNRELAVLSEMGRALQASATVEEAHSVIASSAEHLFPGESGVLCIMAAPEGPVETAAVWGGESTKLSHDAFSPDDCHALRQRSIYAIERTPTAAICRHLLAPLPDSYLCIPILAQEESPLGLLHLQAPRSDPESRLTGGDQTNWLRSRRPFVATVADPIGVALSNLRLRERLHHQAVRDSLTGLFNRRYLEETLTREISRATRQSTSLAVIMLDLDHFKSFNDTFGHSAGDEALRELAVLLEAHVRGSDVACRYGGEEFTLVLPDASLENALKRAEELRDWVTRMKITHESQTIDTVTASMGLACFPEHGSSAEALLRAADAALYRAKAEGRNRVVVAG